MPRHFFSASAPLSAPTGVEGRPAILRSGDLAFPFSFDAPGYLVVTPNMATAVLRGGSGSLSVQSFRDTFPPLEDRRQPPQDLILATDVRGVIYGSFEGGFLGYDGRLPETYLLVDLTTITVAELFAGEDRIFLTSLDDEIDSGKGDDKVYGDGGFTLTPDDEPDPRFSSFGFDTLRGEAGNDTLFGEGGEDVLIGGPGFDSLFGGPDGDTLRGQAARDTLFGEDGADEILGNGQRDEGHGGPGEDTLWGGAGRDRLFGDGEDDTLYGERGGDLLVGGLGGDDLFGGGQDDTIYGDSESEASAREDGKDSLEGGPGEDELYGGGGRDTIYGGSMRDRPDDPARPDDDFIDGGAKRDFLYGGAGDDEIYGGGGHDRLEGDTVTRLTPSSGDDYLDGGTGRDTLLGGGGMDELFGGRQNDILRGHAGDDYLEGGPGRDDLYGGAGADTFAFQWKEGHTTVHDFEIGIDELLFSDEGRFDPWDSPREFAREFSDPTGGGPFGVEFDFGRSTVTVLNVTLDDLYP